VSLQLQVQHLDWNIQFCTKHPVGAAQNPWQSLCSCLEKADESSGRRPDTYAFLTGPTAPKIIAFLV